MRQTHNIHLGQYTPSPSDINLGTKDSYGIEQLKLIRSKYWEGLSITAIFSSDNGQTVEVAANDQDMIEVPAEATGQSGVIVIVGLAENQKRISTNIHYTVQGHAASKGDAPGEVPPTLLEQLTDRVQGWYEMIQAAIKTATDTVADLLNRADAGEFDGRPGKDGRDGIDGQDGYTPIKGVDYFDGQKGDRGEQGQKGDKGDPGQSGRDGKNGKDGVTPDLKIGIVRTVSPAAPAAATITGTAESPLLNLDIPKGQPGDGVVTVDDAIIDNSANPVAGGAVAAALERQTQKITAIFRGSKNLLDLKGHTQITINGVTFTPVYDENGYLDYINVDGTASNNANYYLITNMEYQPGQILNGCPTGNTWHTRLLVTYKTASGNWIKDAAESGQGYTLESLQNAVKIDILIQISKGGTVNNQKFYPMLRASGDGTYEKPLPGLLQLDEWIKELSKGGSTAVIDVYARLTDPSANDVTAELNRILSETGKIYFFRKGRYNIGGTVNVPQRSVILGESNEDTYFYTNGTGKLSVSSDTKLSNFRIIGNWNSYTVSEACGDGIYICGHNVLVDRVKLLFLNRALVIDQGSSYISMVKISNCVVTYFQKGVEFVGDNSRITSTINGVEIEHCNFNADARYNRNSIGLLIKGADNMLVAHNYFELIGKQAIVGERSIHNLVIRDNIFERNSYYTDDRYDIWLQMPSDLSGTTMYNFTVTGNLFINTPPGEDVSQYPGTLRQSPLRVDSASQVKFFSNSVESNSYAAIQVNTAQTDWLRTVNHVETDNWDIDYLISAEQGASTPMYGISHYPQNLTFNKYKYNRSWCKMDCGNVITVQLPSEIIGKYVVVHCLPVNGYSSVDGSILEVNGYKTFFRECSDMEVNVDWDDVRIWKSLVIPYTDTITITARTDLLVSPVYVIQEEEKQVTL